MPSSLSSLPGETAEACERNPLVGGFVNTPPLGRLYPRSREIAPPNLMALPRGRRPARQPVLLGACDRHNLGDLLMPLLLTRLLNGDSSAPPIVAGLRQADLRSDGGLAVEAYASLVKQWSTEEAASPRLVLHFGGETLGCGLDDAYAMTLDAGERALFAQHRENSPRQALAKIQQVTGQNGPFAYLARQEDLPGGSALAYHAVGLAQPEALSSAARQALIRQLEPAAFLGVRDEQGARFLEESGLRVHRMPCVVTALPWICGDEIARVRESPALTGLRERFPKGWIAVQISAYRKKLYTPTARAVADFARARGLGVVFLAAGLAPGHDDPAALARLAQSLPSGVGHFLATRHVWELAAAVMGAELFCGTSLHGRILAMAAGIPRLSLAARFAKIGSYCRLWEYPGLPVEVEAEELPRLLPLAAAQDRALLRRHARWLSQRYGNALGALAKSCRLELKMPSSPLAEGHPLAIRA